MTEDEKGVVYCEECEKYGGKKRSPKTCELEEEPAARKKERQEELLIFKRYELEEVEPPDGYDEYDRPKIAKIPTHKPSTHLFLFS